MDHGVWLKGFRYCGAFLLAALISADAGASSGVEVAAKPIMEMSLEELMSVSVTSVAKTAQPMLKAPAAIFVITNEDIRRIGATSIPEALRIVPGLHVARVDANKWAITSRGFSGQFSNKLLVLIDGRTVYSPLYSGVYWDVQDTPLFDIDRIEVIRGPGATLWGANAVNGVINIVTKHSRETQGVWLNAGGGSEDEGMWTGRYGGKLGEHWAYRAYAKGFTRDDFLDASGNSANDEWHMNRAGFRTDGSWEGQELTLQGEIYKGKVGQTLRARRYTSPYFVDLADDIKASGGDLLGRWSRSFSEESNAELKLYYDRTDHSEERMGESRDTFDADTTLHFPVGERQEIVAGAGYRFSIAEETDTDLAQFRPRLRHDKIASAFVQHTLFLLDRRLQLTTGSKFEYNNYTEFEVQPSIRALYLLRPEVSLWGSVSRAVRTPAVYEFDLRYEQTTTLVGATPLVATYQGSGDVKPEEVYAWELGIHAQPAKNLAGNLAAFCNIYDNLATSETGATSLVAAPTPHLETLVIADNNAQGETYGIEFDGQWDVTKAWRINAAYTWFDMRLHADLASNAATPEAAEKQTPNYQMQVRSHLDVTPWLEFNTALYYLGAVTNANSYARLDLGWAVTPVKDLTVSLWLYNLLDGRHVEFSQPEANVISSEIQRSIYAQVDWRF